MESALSLFIADNSVLSLRLNMQFNGETVMYNMFHYRVSNLEVIATGLPPAVNVTVAEMASGILTGWLADIGPAYADCVSASVLITGASLWSLYPAPRSRQYNHVLAVPMNGGRNAAVLPAQDAVTILKRTDYGTRDGLGRFYMSGIAEEDQDGGVVDNDLVTLVSTLCTAMDGALSVNNGVYTCDISPVLFKQPPGGGASIIGIRSHELSNTTLKTQRRRRPGKGI